MCGIAGFLCTPGQGPAPEPAIRAMMAAIAHRGPDSRGHWADPEAGAVLGHVRLAIVDLSPAGHQPMLSPSGRYVLSFNGEIYNHQALRRALEESGRAPRWHGSSDTETLLAGIDAWGLRATLERAIGMFALGLWDRESRSLTLVRDRMGEKPLYYGWQGQGPGRSLMFGSELKALRAHPAFEGRIARNALVEVLRHGHVGEDRSIHDGIAKVRPGEIVTITASTGAMTRETYWDGAAIAAAPKPPRMSDRDAVDRLEALLMDAVGQQMMSDVPLGAFLSGGIDSSTVVALMQRQSDRPVHTFSIGFHEARYNEAEFARAVAAHLGTRHTDLYVSDQDLRDVVPLLPRMYDEPFADSSQIPTYLVSKLARSHVTVSLSGDGGDELFCGYGRYRDAARLRARLAALPAPLRRAGGSALRAIPAGLITRALVPLIPTPQGKEPIGQRLHRLANYARQPDLDSLHRTMVSVWRFPEAAVPGASHPTSLLDAHLPPRGGLGDIERMMQLDMLGYMVDDILVKVDRASMAVALESRAPLLDPRVVEFAWALPEDQKLRDGVTKWALRQVLYRHVPPELIERPKMGFEVPIGIWLRGGLKDWAAALLEPARLRREGHFDADLIGRMWQQHLSEHFNWGAQLWCVLMVQSWLENTRQVSADG
ncbi:asparagine synthase (glutamine-hydrolyzing) [Rhodovulum sp.]|uniref:asparagine synthase (glutamine-hydrolyzing) n=1 Tax=Rhodovulum sp. TaxID=34009 RepID=UPI00183A8014|nr:asparagine synthase (glutamine-hydrolyzing) [Rhodovulum sp.]HDR28490.1 asparagine synthase (glutamine-hydrolyzing) [Rhodovulum sp.]